MGCFWGVSHSKGSSEARQSIDCAIAAPSITPYKLEWSIQLRLKWPNTVLSLQKSKRLTPWRTGSTPWLISSLHNLEVPASQCHVVVNHITT